MPSSVRSKGEHVHRSADEVHAAARRSVPEVSLATVYSPLNELVARPLPPVRRKGAEEASSQTEAAPLPLPTGW